MYDVILADPCWRYRNVKTGGSHTSGSAQKYPTMSLAELRGMPVKAIAAPASVLFLWATTPLGDDPYRVLEDWGFSYKTRWYWHKVGRMGLGYWTRGEVEELLIGTRGNVKAWRSSLSNYLETEDSDTLLWRIFEQATRHTRATSEPEYLLRDLEFIAHMAQGGDVLHTKPAGHSKKPEEIQERIEALTPDARRVELFATRPRAGWDTFGLALDPAHDFRSPEFWDVLRRTAEGPPPLVPEEVRPADHAGPA